MNRAAAIVASPAAFFRGVGEVFILFGDTVRYIVRRAVSVRDSQITPQTCFRNHIAATSSAANRCAIGPRDCVAFFLLHLRHLSFLP